MPRLPVVPAEEKARIVLNLLSGRTTLSVAAQAVGVSTQAVSTWRRQFVDSGRQGLRPADRDPAVHRRERQLRDEITGLKAALGEAHLALRNLRRNHFPAR